jgi:hypothetical protein
MMKINCSEYSLYIHNKPLVKNTQIVRKIFVSYPGKSNGRFTASHHV